MASPIPDSRPLSGFVPGRHMRTRTQSFSSDRPSVSTVSHGLLSPPLSVSPAAAFIAETAASQIITNDHDNHASTWYDQNDVESSGETALVSPSALHLVNGFLDQLLFNFLQVAKSTRLSALRPAVSEILKPKLARDIIHNADEELREYLGDADEDDYTQSGSDRDWDLELAWKRARLRCMVYSSLGDLEEEDEDMYMQQENLEIRANEDASDVISPAVAIFLTSVIEYLGELTLITAGQAACQRVRSKIEKEFRDGTRNPNERADRIAVDEMDMERVALDRTLGRLWRGWKKRIRAPAVDTLSRSFSVGPRDSVEPFGPKSPLSDSSDIKKIHDHLEDTITEDVQPKDIPLPMGDNDVDEIEVPGLVRHSDDDDEREVKKKPDDAPRPKSLDAVPTYISDIRIATLAERHPAVLTLHKRSHSLPTPNSSAFHPNMVRSKKEGKDVDASSFTQPIPKGRLPKLVTGSALARHSDGSESDDALERATYEKAEIVTSSRVSVASTSSRSASDSGRAMHVRRSSSVHSARIVDVPAPRSPAHSRPPSFDTTERSRSVSLSGSTPLVQSFTAEEPRKTKVLELGPRIVPAVTAAKSSVDRMRPVIQNATTISESEEEIDDRSAKAPVVANAVSPRSRDPMGHVPYGLQTNFRQADRKISSPKTEAITPGTKMTIIRNSNSGSAFVEEGLTDMPRKTAGHPNWQSNKNESKAMSAVERTRSNAEEEAAMPFSIVPPRQIHTSGSSGSSGTGRLKALRSSEESSSRAESVARNFEELIQSNQTISYTLTPENMRDINVKSPIEGPVVPKISRKSDELRGPPAEVNTSPSSQQRTYSTGTCGCNGFVGSSRGPQARDARVPGESMADFAEFIKSTGPPGDKGPIALRNVHVPTSPTKRGSVSRRVSTTSSLSNHSANRSRFQAREPVADPRDNSDLVDFIRQGPTAPTNGQHRIPRHVAPFRNTMDSDQFSGAIGGKAIDAMIPEIRYSQASTNFTENSMPSMQSSINSSSALLRNKGSGKASKMFEEEEAMPVRKQRRVRDPYAIDFSDEEDGYDEYDPAPRPPAKKEESLAEFLRNYEPPSEPVSQAPGKALKKKTSSPSLIGRFGRTSSKDTPDSAGSNETQSLNSRTSTNTFAANESRFVNSRTGSSKHIPLVVNMPPGYDMYGPIAGYSEQSNSSYSKPFSTAPAPRVPMKTFEPREPVALGQTADLAAFLRDSAPPPNHSLPQTPIRQEETNGISKMFSRRKKTAPL
ncbi:hypothetical protein PT974_11617 [Cladobotryum mycophilum]|uniref:Flo11 n=1 Tax=Cladobotryum mycophilum TaxID=491253 RepID=A0ABR0S5Q5_9HYPO